MALQPCVQGQFPESFIHPGQFLNSNSWRLDRPSISTWPVGLTFLRHAWLVNHDLWLACVHMVLTVVVLKEGRFIPAEMQAGQGPLDYIMVLLSLVHRCWCIDLELSVVLKCSNGWEALSEGAQPNCTPRSACIDTCPVNPFCHPPLKF